MDGILTDPALRELLKTRMDTVRVFSAVSSTNDVLMDMAEAGAPDGQIVAAAQQTAGRGRSGRSFVSPPGLGLYFSYFIKGSRGPAEGRTETAPSPGKAPALEDWLPLTSWTAVAAADAVRDVTGISPDIKWVNDLYMKGKKICGILVQPVFGRALDRVRDPAGMVVGIGINVKQRTEDFPPELREKAASIEAVCGRKTGIPELAAALVRRMDGLRAAWPEGGKYYLERYRALSIAPGREITVIDGKGESAAYAVGIGDDFSLLIRRPDGTEEALRSGEISIRI